MLIDPRVQSLWACVQAWSSYQDEFDELNLVELKSMLRPIVREELARFRFGYVKAHV